MPKSLNAVIAAGKTVSLVVALITELPIPDLYFVSGSTMNGVQYAGIFKKGAEIPVGEETWNFIPDMGGDTFPTAERV